MTRGFDVFGFCLLTVVAVAGARADELPIRKAGLWEIKMVHIGSPLPEMTTQQCTDDTVDKDLNKLAAPMAKQICAGQDIQKTATGYVSDSVCSASGISVSTHVEVSGDFNSAYTATTSSHSARGSLRTRDTVTKIEAKWLGACRPDQRPGDIVIPGGFKLNIKDADKLRALLPGAKQ